MHALQANLDKDRPVLSFLKWNHRIAHSEPESHTWRCGALLSTLNSSQCNAVYDGMALQHSPSNSTQWNKVSDDMALLRTGDGLSDAGI